jgi:Spy/CpxP family protein refolding chaperone
MIFSMGRFDTNLIRTMRSISPTFLGGLLLACCIAVALPACRAKTGPAGVKVKQPFTGNKYESNAAWWRGTGMGASSKQNIARGKADSEARSQLASQVGTNMRAVTDQYLGQTENERARDVADKFQSLVREVMNTELADMRKIGEETYFNETTKEYTVYVAYEIRKNAMLRFMRKQARTDAKIDELTRKQIEEILDQEIERADKAPEN